MQVESTLAFRFVLWNGSRPGEFFFFFFRCAACVTVAATLFFCVDLFVPSCGQAACKFYEGLMDKAVNNCHVIDIFACSLDQIGLLEMKVQSTFCFVTSRSFSDGGVRSVRVL